MTYAVVASAPSRSMAGVPEVFVADKGQRSIRTLHYMYFQFMCPCRKVRSACTIVRRCEDARLRVHA